MAKTKNWIAKICTLGVLLSASIFAEARFQDGTIYIDRALNSPTLTVRYVGAHASVIELMVNGASFGTRSADPRNTKGETNFTLDLSALKDGDNEVEVRLYDQNGKLVGTEKSDISTDEGTKAPVYLIMPKVGSTVQGAVSISLGFGKDLHNTYVSFFIDNQFKAMTNSPPFSYIWDTTRDSNGWHEVEAWVVDDSSTTYKTHKVKLFVNNPGGNTARHFEPAAAKAPKPAPTVVPPAPTVQPSATIPSASVGASGASAGLKGVKVASAGVVEKVVAAIAPQVTAHFSTATPIQNAVTASTGASAGLKAVGYAASVATGPQMLTPTGKRLAITKTAGSAQAPKVAVQTVPSSASAHVVKAAKSLPILPNVTAVMPSVPAMKGGSQVGKTARLGSTLNSVASASLLPVGHGTKLPALGVFPILLDAKPVMFDSVKPRVQDGIPLTPFRYLFEQSGGTVDWDNPSKTVQANGHGRDIYIKIGNKLAKVNNFPIQMDLAPFIENGRTVVPLSFIQDSLDVNVDYDPATGHVLITSKKKTK